MMNVKKVIKALFLSFLTAFGLFSAALADTILFPVIAVNMPNVTTIVTVLNRIGGTSTHLHYIYRYKDTYVGSSPNISGSCASVEFTRSTSDCDLVSFDASGCLNGGNALFGDTDSYGGSFHLPGSGAKRAYLLVTNSDSSGTRVGVGHVRDLGGQAVIMDIAAGAAWGMKAINDNTREDYTFTNVDDGGGVWSAIPSNGYTNRRFTFYPPNEWTTRFFVTPIGSSMNSANLTATVNLISTSIGGGGLFDLMSNQYTFTPIDQSVTGTAGVDLEDLVDSSVWSAIETCGGWSWFQVASGDAVVYKLEYVVNDLTYGGTNNNGYLLSTYGMP
jgi:hypothetical protein